jgi:hypothetical protein
MAKQLGADVELPAAIRAVIKRLLETGRAKSGVEINSGAARAGNCEDFISRVYQELGGIERAYAFGIAEMGVEALLQFDPVEDFGGEGKPFDRELISQHWPNVVPPTGLSWADMDRLSAYASFSGGTHVWMLYEGKHFDCECPDGVENPFELPLFQRVISSWQAEGLHRANSAMPACVAI